MSKPPHLNRRCFLRHTLGLPLAAAVCGEAAEPSYVREYPDMLLAYLAGKTNALAAKWDVERGKIRTARDLEERNRFVREKFARMIHLYPERTPLHPVTVSAREREGYRVENVMFQSRPNFWVTGNLYVPTSGKGPFPGIISPCGHEYSGRMYRLFQFTYQDLAKNGFVVLGYDPIGQGERRQYWNPATKQQDFAGPVTWEHSLPGQLLLLMGEDITHYRVWDGMRAIDYLLTRSEVDAKRIGCTGQSGGGTFTMFLGALDQRIQCAAVHEGGTGHRWPVRIRPESRIETGDTDQHYYPGAVYGIDLCDLDTAIAPRPLLVSIEDYSLAFEQTARHIRAGYELLGVPERFTTVEANDPHAMTAKLRLSTVDWFSRWFYGRRGPERESGLRLEPEEDLYCTPNGSVRYSRQGDTIFSLILKKQAQLPPPRKMPTSRAELDVYRREITSEIERLIRYRRTEAPLGARRLVVTPRTGYSIEKLEFLSEPGIYIPAWVFVPDRRLPDRGPILYVHESGKEAEGLEFGVLEELARHGIAVTAIDVRGIGETRPPHPGEDSQGAFAHVDDIETVMSYMAWEIDESLFGMRVEDVVRGVDYVLSRPDAERRGVSVIGRGMGALWALFAAALDDRINALVLDGGLLSYRSLTSVDRYLHGADVFVPDVLKHFDLPEVAAALADRPLALLSPVDAMKKMVEISSVRREYQCVAETYRNMGAENRFRLSAPDPEKSTAGQYLDLLA